MERIIPTGRIDAHIRQLESFLPEPKCFDLGVEQLISMVTGLTRSQPWLAIGDKEHPLAG
jgi:hypothetical protein